MPAKSESAQDTKSAAISAQPAESTNNQQAPASLSNDPNNRAAAVAVPQPASNQGEPVREDVAALQREQPEARTPAPAIDTRQNNPPVAAELPATASNWFAYLLGGALLLALAGLSFRAGARE